ncbi:glycosyltransferase [Siansivirga zeaxanthinifaciens]|uniref:Glycosyl transferase family 2 n=1 Tax=Siansivirga zeaxanthinifaciens CC-SAMT-1 TaxID=1454006 RepID=A0A0C5WLG5_9FLAO|nr:glycosyltransferase [Siansivirga zeaxanthinifaciens]AJR03650.1 glycosyl transferase family 2 [Siansivirga zeaxanthinifaciens CC-SAMT-1]
MGLLDFLFYAFAAVVVIQVVFYLFFFGKFAFLKQKKQTLTNVPVSVIICAKNEAENLKNNLPKILSQKHPNFEVVLINDASSDDTLDVMEHFQSLHSNIKIVDVKNIEAFWGNKKYALTLGIKAATKDYLLFTDADCMPVSEYWIQEMTGKFTKEKTIVLGYGAYSKIKNSFLNKLIRFETLNTALNYFSFANAGIPYMGVGRNLAYNKSEFFKTNGFIKHIKVLSGDDDLFVNEAATKSNTIICDSKNSFTESIPKNNFKSWIKQKRRHISTAKYYKTSHKLLLSSIYLLQFLFWVFATILLISQHLWMFVTALIVLRITTQYVVFGAASKKLNESDLVIFTPFLEVFLIFIQLTIFINNIISKPNHWK